MFHQILKPTHKLWGNPSCSSTEYSLKMYVVLSSVNIHIQPICTYTFSTDFQLNCYIAKKWVFFSFISSGWFDKNTNFDFFFPPSIRVMHFCSLLLQKKWTRMNKSLTGLSTWYQFHQHFSHNFFVQKQIEHLSLVMFQLCNFWRKNFVQKMCA